MAGPTAPFPPEACPRPAQTLNGSLLYPFCRLPPIKQRVEPAPLPARQGAEGPKEQDSPAPLPITKAPRTPSLSSPGTPLQGNLSGALNSRGLEGWELLRVKDGPTMSHYTSPGGLTTSSEVSRNLSPRTPCQPQPWLFPGGEFRA